LTNTNHGNFTLPQKYTIEPDKKDRTKDRTVEKFCHTNQPQDNYKFTSSSKKNSIKLITKQPQQLISFLYATTIKI